MHWGLILSAAALAVVFYAFGAMAVWVAVLSITLKAVLLGFGLVAIAVALVVIWRRMRT